MLHKLVIKIEKFCIRLDDHKQEVFNLMQVLRTLFLYMQMERESVEEYS